MSATEIETLGTALIIQVKNCYLALISKTKIKIAVALVEPFY